MRSRAPLAFAFSLALLVTASRGHAQHQDFQAGGLAPPPPNTGPSSWSTQPSETERLLQEADEADSGRGLEIAYFDIEGGGQYINLHALSMGKSGLLPSAPGSAGVEASGFGPMFGAGAGVRLVFLTLGPRFRFATLPDWDLWSLGGEVGFHIPLGNLEPYFKLGAGYTKVGNATKAIFGERGDVKIDGFDVQLGGGADYYLTNVLSIGARAGVDLLLLKRGGVDFDQLAGAADGPEVASAELYGEAGSGVGLAATASVVIGLHF